MSGTNEAFSRVRIDTQLQDQGWEVLDTNSVRFEYVLPDNTRADYVLCDRNGRALAVIEAKNAAINPAEAEVQARGYAEQLKVPYIFLANGEEIRFWDWQREAFPRPIKTFFSQGDLERRVAMAQVKRNPLAIPIGRRTPPKPLQKQFEDRCLSAQSIAAQQNEALKEAEAAIQALLARAFSGNLTTSAHVEDIRAN
jgi:type I restriction enzyme R subunit